MLRVKQKNWIELLLPKEERESASYELRANQYSPLRLWALLVGCTFIVGFFNRIGVILGFSLLTFAVVVYWRTFALAKMIRLKRTSPKNATEKEFIEISYEVMNTSAFSLTHYFVVDRFSGTKTARIFVDGGQEIKGASAQTFRFHRKCDAGMGIKEFGPMTAVVTDPLGLFEFHVIEDEIKKMEIFPKLEEIPEIPLVGSKDSYLYGLYDVQVKGGSVNFIGIRDYVPGDSLRHISWKLSAKYSKLLVKEFEKVVNTDVSLILNMNGREHMGQHSESTWEFMKDISLALVTQQIAAGNGVQLISDKAFVPLAKGANHAHEISLHLFDLKPVVHSDKVSLIRKYREFIPRGSTVIYVTPVFSQEIEKEIAQLKVLQGDGIMIRAMLLDAGTFISGKLKWERRENVESELFRAQKQLKAILRTLAIAGIPTNLVALGPSVGKELLKPAVVGPETGSRPT